MNLHKYTIEELKIAVKSSLSIRATLLKLGVAAYGGNYQVFRRAIKEYDVDTSHFIGKGWNKGKPARNYRETKEYLCKGGAIILSHKLRLRLLKEGYFDHICSVCKRTEWNGQPISLELHHINGDRADNNIENLSLMCPNCHAQTSTYRGKNKKKT